MYKCFKCGIKSPVIGSWSINYGIYKGVSYHFSLCEKCKINSDKNSIIEKIVKEKCSD